MKALQNLKYGQELVLKTNKIEVVIYKNNTNDYTVDVKEPFHYSMDDQLVLTVGFATTYTEAKEIAQKTDDYINNVLGNFKTIIRKVDLSK